jgi:hypothetical protein
LAGREKSAEELREAFAKAIVRSIEPRKIAGFYRELGNTRAFQKYHPKAFQAYEEMN